MYPTKPVSNFPAQEPLPSRELAMRLADQAEHFGAELREWRPVEHVGPDASGGYVLRTDFRQDEAHTLVLALGLGTLHAAGASASPTRRSTWAGV